jgi:hypothetical protein
MEHGFFYHYCIHCYVQTSVRIVEASSYLCFAQVWNALARWFFTHGSNPHFSGSPETFKNVDIFVIECCESFFPASVFAQQPYGFQTSWSIK